MNTTISTATALAARTGGPIGFHGHFGHFGALRRNNKWAKRLRLVASRIRRLTSEMQAFSDARPCMSEAQCLRYHEIYRESDAMRARLYRESDAMR